MCLSDANEWFLHSSSVSPHSVHFSSSLHLPAWSVRETTERDFSTSVMKLPQGDSRGKLGWLSSFLLAWQCDRWKCLKGLTIFVGCPSEWLTFSSQEGVFGYMIERVKVCRWLCWDTKVCGFVYLLYMCLQVFVPSCVVRVKCGVKESPMWRSAQPWLIALWANSPVLGYMFFCNKVWSFAHSDNYNPILQFPSAPLSVFSCLLFFFAATNFTFLINSYFCQQRSFELQ